MNAVMRSFEDEKDGSTFSPLNMVNPINHDTPDESCSIRSTILEKDVVLDPPISTTLESDMTQTQCNLEPECSQTKERKKNGHRNRKKKSPKSEDDDLIDVRGDASTIKDNLITTNSGNDSIADNNGKTDLKSVPILVSSRAQKKKRNRKTKMQELNLSVSTDEAHVSHTELHSIKEEENALISEKQSDSPSSLSGLVKKRDTNDDASVSLVDQRKREPNRRKRKLNISVTTDEAHSSHSELEENALSSGRQSDSPSSPSHMVNKPDNSGDASVILVDQMKRKKQQLNTSLSTGEAHVSCVELESVEEVEEEHALVSKNQSDLPSSPCGMVNKHDNNSEASCVLIDQESDLCGVPSVELSNEERVETGEHVASVKVVENVVAKKTFNCSDVDLTCPESKDSDVTKKDAGLDVECNVQQVPHSLVRANVACADKKLLILDVNGLLADILPYGHYADKADIIISGKAVFKRPFCDDFLQFCFEKFNVGVWSSRIKKNVDTVIDFLMGDSRHKLLFVWHQSHCTDTGFTTVENSRKPLVLKKLRKLWDKHVPGLPWNKGEYNEYNTLLLDDSPYKALCNPANTAIFPHSYQYKDAKDCSLGPGGDLRVYLERLAEAPNVQEYVAQNPFGQRAITESNPSWGFYQKILNVASYQSREVPSSSGNL